MNVSMIDFLPIYCKHCITIAEVQLEVSSPKFAKKRNFRVKNSLEIYFFTTNLLILEIAFCMTNSRQNYVHKRSKIGFFVTYENLSIVVF